MALTISNFLGVIFSCIGVVLGVTGFTTFAFLYHNYHAAVLAFLSAIFASIVFLLNVLDIKNRVRDWYTPENLQCLRLFAFLGLLIGLTATIWYLFIFIYFGIPILPVTGSMVIPSVWGFLTLKWSAVLFFTTRKYSRQIDEEQSLLPGSSSIRLGHKN